MWLNTVPVWYELGFKRSNAGESTVSTVQYCSVDSVLVPVVEEQIHCTVGSYLAAVVRVAVLCSHRWCVHEVKNGFLKCGRRWLCRHLRA